MSADGEHGRAAWIGALLEEFERPLVAYAQRIVGDPSRARDVVQEVFLRLCRENPSEVDGHVAAWLFTVCRNRALDVSRKESRMISLSDQRMAVTESPDPGPADVMLHHETTGEVLDLLAALPENQQEVIRLKFQTGLSYKEIAGVTELSVSNVGYLIHVGLKTLRRKLNVNDDKSNVNKLKNTGRPLEAR